MSFLAATLHLAVIAGGPDWYRYFGAGEEMALAAERGAVMPALVTFGIAVILALWGLYAFSGAGLVRRIPLLRPALVGITTIYLARGLLIVPLVIARPVEFVAPEPWASIVVLLYGAVHAVGIAKGWRAMGPVAQPSATDRIRPFA